MSTPGTPQERQQRTSGSTKDRHASSPVQSPKPPAALRRASAGGGQVELQETDGDTELVVQRLKEAYGFDMPDAAARYIAHIHSRGERQAQPGRSDNKHWQPNSDGASRRKILGRDVTAVSGQVVKHAMRGSRPDGSFDGDFYSGGGLGTITGDCPVDYASDHANCGHDSAVT